MKAWRFLQPARTVTRTRACPQLGISRERRQCFMGGQRDLELTMRRYALRDDQWDRIKDRLPGREGHVGVTAKDNRLFVEAVLYRYRAGIPWRDLPERFGDPETIHTRFSRWAKSGVWERVFNHLSDDADNEYAMIDSTIVRAHQHSAGARKKGGEDQAIGRSRGGLSTKIHATVDALGNPTGFHLTGGQEHDLAGAEALLPDLEAETLIADKAFDADQRWLEPLSSSGPLPPATTRPHDASWLAFTSPPLSSGSIEDTP